VPIFEYRCTTCDHRFEAIVRSATPPSCPSCAGTSLEKQLSVFAVGAGGERSAPALPGPCGSCGDPRGPGACGMN